MVETALSLKPLTTSGRIKYVEKLLSDNDTSTVIMQGRKGKVVRAMIYATVNC